MSIKSPGSWRERRPGEASFENLCAFRWRVPDPPACCGPRALGTAGLDMHLLVPRRGQVRVLRPRSLPQQQDRSRRQCPETPRDPPAALQPAARPLGSLRLQTRGRCPGVARAGTEAAVRAAGRGSAGPSRG